MPPPVTRTPSQLTPAPEDEKTYKVMKVDAKGWQVCNTVDGEYQDVFSITSTRLTISERFGVFLGSIPIADVVVGIIRDQLQGTWVRTVITNLIISFLSKWIDFNEDGTITVKGATSMVGNVTLTNNLNVQGTTEFNQDVNFAEEITVNGKASFTNEISASGMVDFAGQVDFNNAVNFDEKVTLNDIEVAGRTVLRDNVKVKGDLFTKGSLRVAGGIMETDNAKDLDDEDEAPDTTPPTA
jgi:cytoskeletal protein CcmA (bactofilin family)